jgi:cytochrome c-type biogenesis protein CcmH/NrfG
LKLKGQQAAQNPSAFPINSATGKQLSQASDPEQNYKTLLQELANQQYESLGQLLEVTGQISELNLVYVMRREQQARVVPAFTPQTVPTSNVPGAGAKPPQSVATVPEATVTPPSKVDQRAYIEQYCRRAEDLIAKNQFAAAIKELRDALKDDPTYSRCHALLGTVYLKQNQLTMARISFDQALKFDPQNPAALDGKREVEKLMKTQGAGKGTTQKTTPQTGKPGKSGGGLFGGLFGGKK